MERLFISLHHLILKFKGIFIVLILLLLLILQANNNFHVSKLLPEKGISANLMENLEAIDFTDRLFFHLELSDSTKTDPSFADR